MSHVGARLGPLIGMLWGDGSGARLLLGPAPVPDRHVVVEEFLVLPSLHRPRVLLPARASAQVQARLLALHNDPGYVGPRSMLASVRKALQVDPISSLTGPTIRIALPLAQREQTLRHIAGPALGLGVDGVSLTLSVPAAGVRPLVRVCGPDGRLHALVKVGSTAVQVARLGQERAALRTLAEHACPGLMVGETLFDLAWHGRRVTGVDARELNASPASTSPDPEAIAAVLSELQAAHPMTIHRLAESAWMDELRARVQAVPTALQEPLQSHLDRITKHYGQVFYALGRSHGDWLPWKMSWTRNGSLAVRDWEHSHAQAPLLLDTLHWEYGVATLLRNRSVAGGVASVREHVRTMPSAPPGLAAVFFAELAVRRAEEVLPGDLASREIALRALRALSLAY